MKSGFVQHMIKALTNALFGFLLVAVLVVTVVSVRYQPPDPWLEPGEAVAKLVLSSVVANGTFQTDDSILHTGEDFAPADNATSTFAEASAITEEQIKLQQADFANAVQDGSHDSAACSSEDKTINCSDPAVLAAVEAYNLRQFPDLSIFTYQTPVRGRGEDECDVAWKFRAKKEKSWRMYRDFRRFTLAMGAACNVSVINARGWHSGKNAKHLVARRGADQGPLKQRPQSAQSLRDKNVTKLEEIEVIEDSIAKEDVGTFGQHRYLFYGTGGDHCKKMSHYLWSFLCALGEAQYLNRTLVMDLSLCLSSVNNPGHSDEDGKDFRWYFDFAHLKDAASVVEQKEFLEEWGTWNQRHPHNEATVREVVGSSITPMDLREENSIIVTRKFELPEPDNYWFRVCEGETENVVQRPWHLLWKSKRIMDIVNAICGQMEWDFDSVHVVRGDKVSNKELWPNLDADTSPEALITNLRDEIDTSRYVYIASNEREPGYFDPLKNVYKKVRTLEDFSALWAEGSLWYNQTLEVANGNPVEFDGYMRAEVDTEVTFRAKKQIETFGFLTNDCKDGVYTC